MLPIEAITALAAGNQPATSADEFTLSAHLSVLGSLTINSGLLEADEYNIFVSDSWINNGGVFDGGGAIVTLADDPEDGIILSGGQPFAYLKTDEDGGEWTMHDRLTVTGRLRIYEDDRINANSYPIHAGWLANSGTLDNGEGNSFTFDSLESVETDLPSQFDQTFIEPPKENNLVGYWKFDEGNGSDVRDATRSGHDGSAEGGVLHATSRPEMSFDNPFSMQFVGDDQQVSVDDSDDLQVDSFTTSIWINIDSHEEKAAIYSKTRTADCPSWALEIWDDGTLQFFTDSWNLHSSALDTDQWYNIVVSYDDESGVASMYVDGELASATASIGPPSYSSADYLQIGRRDGLCSLPAFRGTIDDFRLYNASLTENGVQNLRGGKYAGTSMESPSVYTLADNQEVRSLIMNSGVLDQGDNDLAITEILWMEGGTLTGDDATLTVESINLRGGLLEAPTRINLDANWNMNGGEFDPDEGEIQFTGHEQHLSGDTTFYDFTLADETLGTMYFSAGDTFTIAGDMSFHGYAGHYEFRSSDGEGVPWYIDPQGARDLSYLDVQASVNINDEDIDCTDSCVDSGDNVGWFFGAPECGNGAVESGEACDDGNATAGDGCSLSCEEEDGWNCTGDEESTCTAACYQDVPGSEFSARLEDVCYASFSPDGGLSWEDSQESCEELGGTIAIIDTGERQSFATPFAVEFLWIGLAYTEEEGTFKWVDGSSLGYDNWYSGQPNGDTEENCALMEDSTLWHDYPCTATYAYLCQIPQSAPASSSSTASSAPETQSGGGQGGGGGRITRNVTRGESSDQSNTPARERVKVTKQGDTQVFRDVWNDDWFGGFVKKVVELGIFSGYKDKLGKPRGRFGPADSITLGQLAKVAAIITKQNIEEALGEQWAGPYIANAKLQKLTVYLQLPDENAPATRGQVIHTLLEALGIPLDEAKTLSYLDVRRTNLFFRAIETATRLGIISGDDATGKFRPNDPVNRAEVAKMIILALEKSGT